MAESPPNPYLLLPLPGSAAGGEKGKRDEEAIKPPKEDLDRMICDVLRTRREHPVTVQDVATPGSAVGPIVIHGPQSEIQNPVPLTIAAPPSYPRLEVIDIRP